MLTSAMQRADVIVVGAGLAGLSCGIELSSRGRRVLLLESCPVVGGRTSSWDKDGMMVESGFHRVLGFYEAFPDLLRKSGIDVNQIVYWEDEVEIRLPDGRGNGVFGAAPLFRPFETLGGLLGNFELLSLVDRITLSGFLTAGLHSLSPGTDALRPPQATPVEGLTLAGDYTCQQYLATMEGAVVSGRLAARAVERALRRAA